MSARGGAPLEPAIMGAGGDSGPGSPLAGARKIGSWAATGGRPYGGLPSPAGDAARRAAVALLVIVTWLVVAPPSVAAPQPPYWQRFDVEIDLQQNGDFLVAEDQVVVFGPTSARHGFREIPLDRVVQITDVSVAEPGVPYRRGTETPYSFQVGRTEEFLRIDWWFPPTANAARNFVVGYRVVGGLRYYPEGDQLYWKAIYADRPYPIESASVVVRFPVDLASDQVRIAAYPERLRVSGALVDPRTVRFDGRGLPAGTGLEVRVQFPHGLVAGEPPPWQVAADRSDWYNQNLRPVLNLFLGALGVLVVLAGSIWVFLAWYSWGRDPAVGEVPPRLTEPPGDLPPAAAGTLVDGRADVQDAVASVVDLARRGVLRIVEEQRPRAGAAGHDFRLELLEERQEGLRDYERTILDSFFAEGRSARFSRLGQRFREAIPTIQRQLYAEVVRAGFFPESPEAVRHRHRNLGLGLLFVGGGFALLLASLLGGYAEMVWAPFAALALVGLAEMAASAGMPRRTEEGALAAARWRAFGRYLAERQPPEELESRREAFEPYLPYAVALGVDRQWVRKFASVGAPAPGWYEMESPPIIVPRGPGPRWGGGVWGAPAGPGKQGREEREAQAGPRPEGRPSLQELSDRGAFDLQELSDSLAEMLNRASEVLARGGRGGWSGGGGFGGGGGGGGRGGFS